ncbi:MAG: sigma 54-interacting transcriptional regulator [Candidatus Babeliales bacterium]
MTHNLLSFLDALPTTKYFFFLITLISLFLKTAILILLIIKKKPLAGNAIRALYLLTILILSGITIDIAWIMSLVRLLFLPNLNYQINLFFLRISWGFMAILYQSLALFIEILTEERARLSLRQCVLSLISLSIFSAMIFLAFFDINCPSALERPFFEFILRNIETFYLLFILTPSSAALVIWKLKYCNIPLILKTQLSLFLKIIVLPVWICDLIQLYPATFSPAWITNSYLAATTSTVLLNLATYHCAKRLSAMRFLNLIEHVQSFAHFPFVDRFKNILEHLSTATKVTELRHITQRFFKEIFHIPTEKTYFYSQKSIFDKISYGSKELSTIRFVHGFFSALSPDVALSLRKAKILIYDETLFNLFYEKTAANQTLVKFLETINAEIFVPVYHLNTMVAYIIIERFDQKTKLFNAIDRDEICVYASYLSNIIYLVQNRNLEAMLHKEKLLKSELYLKSQELAQYRESLQSFLNHSPQKKIGILLYKNKQFTYENFLAQEFIPPTLNINTHLGHTLVQALHTVTKKVEALKAPVQIFTHITHDREIVITGFPHCEKKAILITLSYPDISDIIAKKVPLLTDQNELDYALYLETTRSGKLINNLIPSNGKKILKFKIELLKCSLNKQAILLNIPNDDLLDMVKLIHQISLREHLHILTLNSHIKNHEIAIKLFGINQLFSSEEKHIPLLRQLNSNGTLFIKNVHFLDIEVQEQLAYFMRHGTYTLCKSNQKETSDVRIICSTDQDLIPLVKNGIFSKKLFDEFQQTFIQLPQLTLLPKEELLQLATNCLDQAVLLTSDLKNFLSLTERERCSITTHQPISLKELRYKIETLLKKKVTSHKPLLSQTVVAPPLAQLEDPDIIQAAQLGKKALKDKKIMLMLWKKFHNQSTIATLLGVHRSSVNRRYKEYNIQ